MYNIHKFIEEAVKKANESGKADTAEFWQELSKNQIALVHLRLELSKAGVDETVITSVNVDKFIQKETSNVDVTDMSKVLSFVNDIFATSIKDATKPSTEAGASSETSEHGAAGSEGGARRRRSVPPHIEETETHEESHGQPATPVPPAGPSPAPAEEMYDGKKLSEYTESDFDASSAYYDFDHPEGNGILATLYADADKPFSLDTEHTFLMMEDESKKVKLVTVPAINTVFTEEVHTEGGQDILIRPQDRYVEGEERDIIYLDKSSVEGASLFKDLLYGLALGSMSNLKPLAEEHTESGSTTTETPAGGAATPAPEATPEEEPADANVGSSNPTGKVITVTFKGGEYCLIDGKAKKKIKVRGSSPEGPVDLGDLVIPSATIKGEKIGHGYQVHTGYWNVESADGTINKLCSDYELMYLQGVNSNLTITPALEATGGGDHL